MLFDPSILVREPLAVLIVLVVIVVAKSVAAFAHRAGVRLSDRIRAHVSASLAQIGEFSFILAGLGVDAGPAAAGGPRPDPGRRAAVDHAQPAGVRGTDRLAALLRKPRPAAARGRAGAPLAPWRRSPDDRSPDPERPAIIVGYGRVGSVVGKGLHEQDLPVVVIEQDRRRVEELRAQGIPAVYGDATTSGRPGARGRRTGAG